MSRKRKAPVRKVYPDPKFHSEVVSKFINSIMYDGKRSTAEKIFYDALDKIQSKNNEDPLKIFNTDAASGAMVLSTETRVFKNGKKWKKELMELIYFDLEGKISGMLQFAR